MSAEQKTLLDIKSWEFGLTELDVIQSREEAIKIVEDWNKDIDDPNEQLRDAAKKSLPSSIKKAEALSSDPIAVLNQVRKYYDRTVELSSIILNEDKLARRLGEEFPELPNYYGLLRRKPWGYHLGQAVMAARVAKQLDIRDKRHI